MYSAAFIFEPGNYDDEFYSLDNQIHEIAESMEGFLGRESWQTADGKRINSTYYWENITVSVRMLNFRYNNVKSFVPLSILLFCFKMFGMS